jgi:hypothetical protein
MMETHVIWCVKVIIKVKVQDCLTLEDETDRLPETSITNYQSMLRNIPEERRSQALGR